MTQSNRVHIGKTVTDMRNRIVEVDGYAVPLTNREFDVWEMLVLMKDSVVSKDVLMFHLYGADEDSPHAKIIDVLVCKMRSKLTNATGGDSYVETVWGRGYVLRDPAPALAQAS